MSDRLWIHPRGGGAFTMSHKIRVNAGQKQIALPNKNVYDGPADVVLTDAEFAKIRPALFPSVLTDLGSLADPDIDASFATDAELAAARNATWTPNTQVAAGQLLINAGQVYQTNIAFTTPAVFDTVNLTPLNPGLLNSAETTSDISLTTNATWQVLSGLSVTPPVSNRPVMLELNGMAAAHSVAQGSASLHIGIYDVTAATILAARTIDYPTALRWAAVPTVRKLLPAASASHTYQAAVFATTAGTFVARTSGGLGWLLTASQV